MITHPTDLIQPLCQMAHKKWSKIANTKITEQAFEMWAFEGKKNCLKKTRTSTEDAVWGTTAATLYLFSRTPTVWYGGGWGCLGWIYGRLLTKPRPCSRPAPAPRCKLGFLAIYSFFSFSCSSFLPVKSLRCCFDLVLSLSLSLSLLVWMHIRYGSLPTTRKVAEKEDFAPEMETSGMCGKNNTNYCPAPFCFAKIIVLLFYGT